MLFNMIDVAETHSDVLLTGPYNVIFAVDQLGDADIVEELHGHQ